MSGENQKAKKGKWEVRSGKRKVVVKKKFKEKR